MSETIQTRTMVNYHLALRHALQHDHVDVVKCLLDNGAKYEVDETIVQKETLHLEAIAQYNMGLSDALKGRCIVSRYDRAMLYACMNGHYAVVEKLLQHGASMEEATIDYKRVSALQCACEFGFLDIAKYLVAHGAKCHSWLLCGPCTNGHLNVVKWLVKDMGINDESAFSDACQSGQLDVVKFLLENRGENIQDQYAIDQTIKHGQREVWSFLPKGL